MSLARTLSDPQDEMILNAPAWRREPHLFSCVALIPAHVGQIRTFLVKVERVSSLRLSDGEGSVGARFNLSKISPTTRALVVEGRSLQVIAKVNLNSLSIYDVTVMKDCSDESLKLRRRVAHLVDHVS